MRVFIAYPLPEELSQKLVGFQYSLLRRSIPLKAYPAQNLHLTTAFLGEIPKETQGPLIKIINLVNRETKQLRLKTTSLSGFPTAARAGTLILKVSGQDIKKLKKARGMLQRLLKEHDFWTDQKAFVPHITLGRVSRPLDLKLLKINTPDISFVLKKMHLFKSVMTSPGPVYQQLSQQ